MKMQIISSIEQLKNTKLSNSACALGTFDGIHLGHQDVINAAGNFAKARGYQLMVFTFSTHPMSKIMPELVPERIIDRPTKIKLLKELNVDILVNIPFNQAIAKMSGDDFLKMLHEANVKAVAVGENYTYGAGGLGNVQSLQAGGLVYDFTVLVRKLLTLKREVISSTHIRKAINKGNVAKANAMLGRDYSIAGVVVTGDQRGRTIDYPTANVNLTDTNIAMPAFGVYAGKVEVEDKIYSAMVNIGSNPTFGPGETHLEAHLFDYSGDLYGQEIRVYLHDYIRPEIKFANIEELKAQIDKDAVIIRNLF